VQPIKNKRLDKNIIRVTFANTVVAEVRFAISHLRVIGRTPVGQSSASFDKSCLHVSFGNLPTFRN